MMNKIFQIIAVTAYMSIVSSCGGGEEPQKVTTTAAAPAYKTMALQPRQISGNVQLPGVMQPYEIVMLYPKVSAFVKAVSVDRGSVVKKGQLLISLEAPEIEQQVAAAKQRYAQVQAAYITSKDRYHRLWETSRTPGTVSPYDLDAAMSKMQGDSAMAQGEYASFKAAEAMRGYLIVTAPFDGVITERNVHPGALAGPTTQNAKPMLVLQQLSRIRLVVDIPEQYAAQVSNGDKVHYKTNALPGQDFEGEVSRSSQSLNNSFRSETIEIDVSNAGNKFKPGMYAEVILPTSGNANAYVVPRSAVITTSEKKYVIIAENNIAKRVDISEGNQRADSTEIFGNLHNGDMIIVNASYQVKDGASIK